MNPTLSELVVARARRAADGFRAASRVLELLAGVLPDTDEIAELIGLRDGLERAFNALTTIDPAEAEAEVRRLEAEIPGLERRLEALDARIPMGWFREHFDVKKASSVALADYAALLGRHIKDSSARLDRIQFLLTRLLGLFVPPAEATHERLRALLAEALPPVQVDASLRQAALGFFSGAEQRLGGVERVEHLIDSGFFVDVFGYKLSLREKLLDPDIMASAIELNEAITRCLRRLAMANASSESELDAHLGEVAQRVRETFQQLREDERPSQQRFEHWLAQNAAKRSSQAAPLPVPSAPARARKVDLRVVLAAGVVVLLGVLWLSQPGERLSDLSPGELAALSPVLASGMVAPKERPRSFVGRVDASRWRTLPPDDRRRAAADLARSLAARGLVSGTVMSDQQVVMRIEQGSVLLVQ